MDKKKYKSPNVKTMSTGNAKPSDSATLGQLFNSLWGGMKANPLASVGTGLNAAANIGGLLDNDKLLGQVAGTALGAFAPGLLGKVVSKNIVASPLLRANLAMGGGTIGSLFDVLRAKQEEEQAMQQQYGGRY